MKKDKDLLELFTFPSSGEEVAEVIKQLKHKRETMEQQHLREILGKPEHPQPMTIKDLMQLLYHAIRVLIKRRKKMSNP